ncbi:MAG: S8 family serine peptidase [Deltaproteobacteria bacterium]|nr:S8 family serine peptidase [Deltaproteobacteria bacterium]
MAVALLASACVDEAGQPSAEFSSGSLALHQVEPVRRVLLVLKVAEDSEQAVRPVQERVERTLGRQFRTTRRYQALPLLAGAIESAALDRAAQLPDVAAIQDDGELQAVGGATTASAGSAAAAVQAKAAWIAGYGGQGVRVAVVDSGVDSYHPDLMGKVIAQKCFSQQGCPPYGAPEGDLASDSNGHGTHVASILAGSGKVAPAGIAPNAELIAVRVLGSGGTGSDSDALAGVDWVLGKAKKTGVRAVNLSLGGAGTYAAACDKKQPAWAVAASAAAKKGVALFVASGNNGAQGSLSAPACLAGAVAVGASYLSNASGKTWPGICSDMPQKAGAVACFSNRSKHLGLIAPGSPVSGAKPGGGTASMSGTSQACPAAAATAALLWSCQPTWSPAKVTQTLKQTGTLVSDPSTGLSFARVSAAAAIAACGKP